MTLFTMASTASGISGGCINPAWGLVQQIFQKIIIEKYYNSFNGGSGQELTVSLNTCWVYVLGPFVGGFLAGAWKHYDNWNKVKLGHL